jgi:hypothetical protein
VTSVSSKVFAREAVPPVWDPSRRAPQARVSKDPLRCWPYGIGYPRFGRPLQESDRNTRQACFDTLTFGQLLSMKVL